MHCGITVGAAISRAKSRIAYEDASGQVTKETTKLTKNQDVVKNYAYDSAGNKSAFAVKVGNDTKLSLKYAYDGESKLTGVTDEKGSEVAGYVYDTDGNLAKRTVSGNGMTTTYTYDYQNRLLTMKNQTDSGVISEYKSEYLLNGQKSKEDSDVTDKDGKKTSKTATYTYDLLGRISKETKTGSEDISYTYDSNNNRKEMKAGNKVTAYKYNQNDELLRTDTLHTDTEEDSVVIYKNDKNGNQLATVNRYEIPSAKKDDTYIDIDVTLGDNRLNENVVNHYNAQNQLTQTLTKNHKVSFTYDAEGLCTSKTVNGEKTVFVWDGDQLVMELSGSGKVQKRYIRGNDRGYGSNLVYSDKGTGTEKQYYVTDLHGNVVQLTDENGKVVKTYEYDSFGNEVKPDDKDENPFRYCGEYFDKETGEIYLRARYYQPNVGRFLTRDTYTGEEDDVLSLHLYAYCDNDGVNQVDPSGHWGKEKVGAKYRKLRGYKYKYVHQNITYYALMSLFQENIKFIESERWFKKLLQGSIAPDKYINNPKHFKKYKIKPLSKNSLHGKSKSKYKGLCKSISKRLKKTSRKKAAYITGIALHTIQDYYAHSYDSMSLAKYRKNGSKYIGKKKYARANAFHSDWAHEFKKIKRANGDKKEIKKIEDEREALHSGNKDNPDMDFDYRRNTWISVHGYRMENKRYCHAYDASYKYLLGALKIMKIIK